MRRRCTSLKINAGEPERGLHKLSVARETDDSVEGTHPVSRHMNPTPQLPCCPGVPQYRVPGVCTPGWVLMHCWCRAPPMVCQRST